ncbi:MAG: hypothetical protein ACI841_000617 [Planctomycetota bacterium]|jgi:hypothetical protein
MKRRLTTTAFLIGVLALALSAMTARPAALRVQEQTREDLSVAAKQQPSRRQGSLALESHWAGFRGLNGAGVATGPHAYPSTLELKDNLRWRCVLPAGNSSPCIRADKIFVTAHIGQTLQTICIERFSGSVLWRRELQVEKLERMHRINGAASSTCAADTQRVYA